MKDWNVWVCRNGCHRVIGKVSEQSKRLARCAALSRFGVSEEEMAEKPYPPDADHIYPDEEFEMTPAD